MSVLDQQMKERRERILEAARRLIERDGYEGFTMRQLAAESRVTAPTLYNLVGNKEEVLFAAVEEQTLVFVATLERTEPDIVSICDATVRELLRRPRYYRSLLQVLVGSESADPARRHVERALAKQIEAALAELRKRGELATWVDAGVLGRQLQSHLDMCSLEWARGLRSATAFRATAHFGLATILLGVTSGKSHSAFERLARDSQIQARGRRRARGNAA